MAYQYQKKEFEQNLAKGISEFNFRDLLLKFGLTTEKEYVKVSIKQNQTIFGSCEVPLKENTQETKENTQETKENIQETKENTQKSLPSVNMSFQDAIINEFLRPNQAIFTFNRQSSLGSEDTDSLQPENVSNDIFSLCIEVGNPVLTEIVQRFVCVEGCGTPCCPAKPQ